MAALKVDENLPAEVSVMLREAGHDGISIYDQQMVGSTDDHILAVCQNEKRAIVTLDLDFADIRSYSPKDYHGIIVLRPQLQDKASVLAIITKLISSLDNEPLSGKLWIVNRQTIRIRD